MEDEVRNVLFLGLATQSAKVIPPAQVTVAIAIGVAAVVVLLILVGLASFTSTQNPFNIIYGADGRPSTSKTQFFLWTFAAVFAYAALLGDQLYAQSWPIGISNIPRNLLISLGFSATTLVAAKAITTNQVNTKQVDKKMGIASGLGAIFQDDAGFADLSKVQLMAWTFIALAAYIANVFHILRQIPPGNSVFTMPDIDDALMVLMGLGSGAYLGKKLVTTDTPRITGVQPTPVHAGAAVTLTGLSFGAKRGGSLITINGNEFFDKVASWGDTQIVFTIPDDVSPATNKPWENKQDIRIGVEVNGTASANTVLCTVIKPPSITSIVPEADKSKVTISGLNFGSQGNINITDDKGIAKAPSLTQVSWSATEIVAKLPQDNPDTQQAWVAGQVVYLTVGVDGEETTADFTMP
jgi:hypothetical protein